MCKYLDIYRKLKKKFEICQMGFPCGSSGKESACNVRDLGLIPGLGRSPGEGNKPSTPIFWPGEFRGLYIPWGRKKSVNISLLEK